MRSVWLAALAVVFLGCREPSVPPIEGTDPDPLRFVPRDLDVVVRLEVEPFGRAFPEWTSKNLEEPSLEPDVLWSRVSRVARSMVLGFRWSREWVPLDGVLVATGVTPAEFETLVPRRLLHGAVDLGGGWYRYDARECDKRTSVCRVYYGVNEVFIAATVAELDAVERTVELRAPGTRLVPESGAAIGVALTAQALREAVATEASKAADFLGRARGFRARVDVLAGKVLVDVESEWESAESAERARAALELYLELLRRTTLPKEVEVGAPEVREERVLVRMVVRRDALVFP